jgi:hypothetical protein
LFASQLVATAGLIPILPVFSPQKVMTCLAQETFGMQQALPHVAVAAKFFKQCCATKVQRSRVAKFEVEVLLQGCPPFSNKKFRVWCVCGWQSLRFCQN